VKRLRLIVATAFAVSVAASLPVGVAAQEEASEPQPLTYATGTAGEPAEYVTPTEERSLDGIKQMRSLGIIDIPLELSDPRLSGLLTISANGAAQDFYDGFAALEPRTYRIVNDDGAWAGSGNHVEAVRRSEGVPVIDQDSLVLAGEGAYEGLLAHVFLEGTRGEVQAVIITAEMPPAPDPVPTE